MLQAKLIGPVNSNIAMLKTKPSAFYFDQCYFFQQLQLLSNCPSKRCFVEELAEVLHQSIKNIYKKLIGTVRLSLEEAVELCYYYEIALGDLITQNSSNAENY